LQHYGHVLSRKRLHGARRPVLEEAPQRLQQRLSVEHPSLCGVSCEALRAEAPAGFSVAVDRETMRASIEGCPDEREGQDLLQALLAAARGGVDGALWSTSPPTCLGCGGPLRPAVLLFGDTDASLVGWLQAGSERYQQWEEQMETQAEEAGARVVLLELGCGMRVPSVRAECEEVLRDTLQRGGQAVLIRVNPDFPDNKDCPHNTISIRDSALSALTRIDAAMRAAS